MESLGLDFSTFRVPVVVKEDPFDFTDPIYDKCVKDAVKSAEEMKALGWSDITITAPSEKIADRLETLLTACKIRYTRADRSIEFFWTKNDKIDVAKPVVQQSEPPSQEEMALLETLMQEMDFGF